MLNLPAIARAASVIALAATLAGCFENEADQRKAFIDFLQTRVIERQGVRVPKPNDNEQKSFGPYAEHYAVITNFTGDEGLTAMAAKLQASLPNITNIQGVIDNREALRKAGPEMGDLLRTMDEKHTAAKSARAALKQPDDLKIVFGKAFDKTVTGPVTAFHESVPLGQEALAATARVADYAAGHRDTVKIVGGRLQATNAKTQTELMALVNAAAAQQPKFNEAQRKLRMVLTGS
jgi:hypothetical protein